MDNLKVDSRMRIDFQNDDGYMMMLTYHFEDKKLEFDYRHLGLPISDDKFPFIRYFLEDIIDYCSVKLLRTNITTIEIDMFKAIIKYTKKNISRFN